MEQTIEQMMAILLAAITAGHETMAEMRAWRKEMKVD
jgi:hypothetical protein